MCYRCAYPDSVSRVKPPNITMPKTLAALPNNQYATLFDVRSGKLLDLPLPLTALSESIALPAFDSASAALLRNGWVDFHLTDCRTDCRGAIHCRGRTTYRIGALRHGRCAKSRRERRGAAVRSCGNAWNIEAMTRKKGRNDLVSPAGSFRGWLVPSDCPA